MTIPNPVLVRAFRALNAEQRENMRWHLERMTPILCGDKATWTRSRDGGG